MAGWRKTGDDSYKLDMSCAGNCEEYEVKGLGDYEGRHYSMMDPNYESNILNLGGDLDTAMKTAEKIIARYWQIQVGNGTRILKQLSRWADKTDGGCNREKEEGGI